MSKADWERLNMVKVALKSIGIDLNAYDDEDALVEALDKAVESEGGKAQFWKGVRSANTGVSKEPIEIACGVIDLYRQGEKKYFTSKAPFDPDLYNLMVLSQISQLREVAEHISTFCNRRKEEIDNNDLQKCEWED